MLTSRLKEEGKKSVLASDAESDKGTKVGVGAVCIEAKRDEDEEDGLFMNMPAKEEGGVGGNDNGTEKGLPTGLPPEDQKSWDLEEEGEEEGGEGDDLGQDGEGCVTHETTSACMKRGDGVRNGEKTSQSKKETIKGKIEGPGIGSPVSVDEAPLEGEEAGEDLGDLTVPDKGSHGKGGDEDDNGPQTKESTEGKVPRDGNLAEAGGSWIRGGRMGGEDLARILEFPSWKLWTGGGRVIELRIPL